VSARLGHWRSGKWTGGNGRYLVEGFLSMAALLLLAPPGSQVKKNPTAGLAVGFINSIYNQNPTAARHSSSALDSSRFKLQFTAVIIRCQGKAVNCLFSSKALYDLKLDTFFASDLRKRGAKFALLESTFRAL